PTKFWRYCNEKKRFHRKNEKPHTSSKTTRPRKGRQARHRGGNATQTSLRVHSPDQCSTDPTIPKRAERLLRDERDHCPRACAGLISRTYEEQPAEPIGNHDNRKHPS